MSRKLDPRPLRRRLVMEPNYLPPPSPPNAIEYSDPGLRSLWRWLRGQPSLSEETT